MVQHLAQKGSIVIGIDVGGIRKGFHAVSLRDGLYQHKFTSSDPAAVAEWCQDSGASTIAIDAPCRWSSTGRARSAERALAAEGIFAFATPSRNIAESKSFYRWMLNGADLYRSIEQYFPLFKGNAVFGPTCFETFPQAVACALAGEIVSAKKKCVVRRDTLQKAGIDISQLANIDIVDAALCAVAANYFLEGRIKKYGDHIDGFIVVPAVAKERR